ncbi:MAG TPA: oxidoreductase [Gammaproteobacteria bacterium]|nr:oxidoreductase [Gammaproteobacteria bacterium]
MTRLSDYDTSHRTEAVVRENRRITPEGAPEVCSIVLRIQDPDFVYVEGQNVGVLVPEDYAGKSEDHFRLFTIANMPQRNAEGGIDIELCVRRNLYGNGAEEVPGIASGYLCDARPGDRITLTGPYGDAFRMPRSSDSNLLMIGSGTGIAPFRAFIQHIYERQRSWQGKVRLFYGAHSGTEMLYQNDLKNDLANYYDRDTFKAFAGLCREPGRPAGESGFGRMLEDNAEEIWELIQDPRTYVYLAGRPETAEEFHRVMEHKAGSAERWRCIRDELASQGRWSELLYD